MLQEFQNSDHAHTNRLEMDNEAMYDLIIRGAKVIDGSGSPFFYADVAVKDGKIAAIGNGLTFSKQELDAHGLVLSPGFIDSHSHDDMMADLDSTFFHKLEQGITTQIAGMCGISAAPFSPEHLDSAMEISSTIVPYNFLATADKRIHYADYLDYMDRPLGCNMGLFVGHGFLRAAVMGLEVREPTVRELEDMKKLLRECLSAGAMGLSFGLIYPPSSYAQTSEILELAKVVTEYDSVVSVHLRNEGDFLVEAVNEMIGVAQQSGCKLVLSHHKAINEQNWGKVKITLSMIDRANQEGAHVWCDQYPYNASSTGLMSRIPHHLHALGEKKLLALIHDPCSRSQLRKDILGELTPEQLLASTMIGSSPSHPEFTGRMLLDIAKEQSMGVLDLLLDILYDDNFSTNGIYFCMQEQDVEMVLRYPRTMIGTDGIYYKNCSGAHPRAFGTFPRVLGRFVREKGILTLEDAIRKMTSLPAYVYGLKRKGTIRTGMDADIVLFHPDTVIDRADYVNCKQRNVGIAYVIVNGKIAVCQEKFTNNCFGNLLRRGD